MSALVKAKVAIAMLLASLAAATLAEAQAPGEGAGVTVRTRYDDPEVHSFLKQVLAAMNVSYSVQTGADGEWLRWVSRGTTEDREIRHRVSQFAFIKSNCKGMSLPSPKVPARSTLSC